MNLQWTFFLFDTHSECEYHNACMPVLHQEIIKLLKLFGLFGKCVSIIELIHI
jgi:hypothetical protein